MAPLVAFFSDINDFSIILFGVKNSMTSKQLKKKCLTFNMNDFVKPETCRQERI